MLTFLPKHSVHTVRPTYTRRLLGADSVPQSCINRISEHFEGKNDARQYGTELSCLPCLSISKSARSQTRTAIEHASLVLHLQPNSLPVAHMPVGIRHSQCTRHAKEGVALPPVPSFCGICPWEVNFSKKGTNENRSRVSGCNKDQG